MNNNVDASFSARVKEELSAVKLGARHCVIAELCAMLRVRGAGDGEGIYFRRENVHAFKRYEALKNALGDGFRYRERPDLGRECCRAAYMRGLFLCVGSCGERHLELSTPFNAANGELAAEATALLERLNVGLGVKLNPKVTKRKNSCVVYLKEGGQISAALSVMGAKLSMLEYEEKRVENDVNNGINRRVNFANANIEKTAAASVGQIGDILLIDRTAGLAALPSELAETARLRLEYPEMSLTEIGTLMNPPMSKSGVSHRLRRLSVVAGKIRDNAT